MIAAQASLTLVLAALCAGLMGYAIQRGATCTVAAVGEIVENRSAHRLVALAEAALWVAGGLLVARQLGLVMHLPSGVAPSGWTLAGGALLGLGAWLNRACVFGAIARLGSGEWAYLATPVGFYLGALTLPQVFGMPAAQAIADQSMLLSLPVWAGWIAVPFALWRLAAHLTRSGRTIWGPHEATLVIGLTFLVLLVIAGPWTYTELLTDAAKGMVGDVAFRTILFVALLSGAWYGGWTAGRFKSRRISAADIARCLVGGLLMGWGSLVLPGGNDSLILVGMPLLHAHAWLGIGTMCLVIAGMLLIERRWA
ncbi:MAG: YeeE/YedE thiosulfate transporter family protein [Sphingomonadaceae bacterium]